MLRKDTDLKGQIVICMTHPLFIPIASGEGCDLDNRDLRAPWSVLELHMALVDRGVFLPPEESDEALVENMLEVLESEGTVRKVQGGWRIEKVPTLRKPDTAHSDPTCERVLRVMATGEPGVPWTVKTIAECKDSKGRPAFEQKDKAKVIAALGLLTGEKRVTRVKVGEWLPSWDKRLQLREFLKPYMVS